MTLAYIALVLVMVLSLAFSAAAGELDILKDFQGIKYDETGRPVGMPMGGVGAGSIEVTSQGTLAEFRNVNNWAAPIPSIPGSGLWVTYRSGSQSKVYPLAGGKVKFEGNFPFAKLEFPDLPVDVTLYCWSPFILHDIKRSAYPAAIFDAVIKNKQKEKAEVGLVLSYGTEYSSWLKKTAGVESENLQINIKSTGKPYAGKSVSGITFSTKAEYDAEAFDKIKQAQKPSEDKGSLKSPLQTRRGGIKSIMLASNTDADYTLAARSSEGAEVFTYQVTNPDALTAALDKGTNTSEAGASVYAVEQRVRIEPGKSASLGLVCSWYAPNHFSGSGHRFGHKYEEWFKDSTEVAEEVAKEHGSLLRDTKKHYDIVATSSLPKWYREMIQSNFYQMPAISWWTKDGIQFTYETPDGCPLFGTMDVRYYGSFVELAAFPEFDAQVLRQFAAVQDPDGFIRHDLGGSSGIADNFALPPAAPVQPVEPKGGRSVYSGYWTNLPVKFCLEAARYYWWTGDKQFLQDMWPHIKRAVNWIEAQDEDGDGLPETQYDYDGWKMVDKCGYDANQWISMLIAVSRLARDMGEIDYAFHLMNKHKMALEQIDKLIWTGSYYRQSAGVDGSRDLDWVSLLQLAGTWYSDILGYKDGLPEDKVVKALQTMDNILGKDAVYGLINASNPDGSRINSWLCDCQSVGWQYFYASHAMYRGMDDIALRVAEEIWQKFTVEEARVPWCQEGYIRDPGKPACSYWLTRDMRIGSALVMSYAAAGLKMDIPYGTALVKPADWIWRNKRFILPIITPKWLGQVRYSRDSFIENYEITNISSLLRLRSVRLRTQFKGDVTVSINGISTKVKAEPEGLIDVGPVELSDKPLLIKLEPVKPKGLGKTDLVPE